MFHITHKRSLTPSPEPIATVITFSNSVSINKSITQTRSSHSQPNSPWLDSSFYEPPPTEVSIGLAKDDNTIPVSFDKNPPLSQSPQCPTAKISRLFGARHRDLSPSLPSPEQPPSRRLSFVKPPVKQEGSAEVDIEVNSPSRFWGLMDGRNHEKEVDIVDVRDQLRKLKAA